MWSYNSDSHFVITTTVAGLRYYETTKDRKVFLGDLFPEGPWMQTVVLDGRGVQSGALRFRVERENVLALTLLNPGEIAWGPELFAYRKPDRKTMVGANLQRIVGIAEAKLVPGACKAMEVGRRLLPAPVVQPDVEVKAASIADARNRLKAVMELYQAKLEPVEGDGNCQFRAMAKQLYGDEAHHAALRAQVVEELRRDRSTFECFIYEPYDEYLTRLAKNGEWGDNVTLQAACNVLGCEILVFTDQPGSECLEMRPMYPTEGGPSKPLCLAFVAEVHYDAATVV